MATAKIPRGGAEARSTSHIKCGPALAPHCTVCGDVLRIGLPVLADVWIAAASAFIEAHRACGARFLEETR